MHLAGGGLGGCVLLLLLHDQHGHVAAVHPVGGRVHVLLEREPGLVLADLEGVRDLQHYETWHVDPLRSRIAHARTHRGHI